LSELARVTRRLKDVDSAEVAFRLRSGAYALMVIGMCTLGATLAGLPPLLGLLAGLAVGAMVYFVSLFIADRSGIMAASVYGTAGSSTPSIREYSLADSLVARGLYDQAAEAYALLSEDFPHDPEPRLRHARLLRDKSARYEEAAVIMRNALSITSLKPETDLAILRELVELYIHKLREPNRALPYLARIVDRHPDTQTGQWARAEAKDIKQKMQADR
jgi:hypothetical protein